MAEYGVHAELAEVVDTRVDSGVDENTREYVVDEKEEAWTLPTFSNSKVSPPIDKGSLSILSKAVTVASASSFVTLSSKITSALIDPEVNTTSTMFSKEMTPFEAFVTRFMIDSFRAIFWLSERLSNEPANTSKNLNFDLRAGALEVHFNEKFTPASFDSSVGKDAL